MSVPRLRHGALYNMQQLSYSETSARVPCCDIIRSEVSVLHGLGGQDLF
jgi:hypothetical protein